MSLIAAVVAASVGWAAPAYAADGDAYESGSILNFAAGSGTVNSVYIRLTVAGYTIDDVAPIVAGANCKHPTTDLTYVECSSAGITEVRVRTYDLNDLIDYLTPTFSRLFAGDGNDRVWGGTGMDWLFGGNGNDFLNAWSGDDQLYWDAGADQLYGGSGWDYVVYKDSPVGVIMDPDGVADDGGPGEGDLIGTDIERLEGSAYGDWIVGSEADNELFGGGGADILLGQGGNDDLYGDAGSGVIGGDYFSGGAGIDRVAYSADHDAAHPVVADLDGASGDDGSAGEGDAIASDVEGLTGGDGNDRIWGYDGNDNLFGENGADTLDGSPGTDACNVGPGGTSVTACE